MALFKGGETGLFFFSLQNACHCLRYVIYHLAVSGLQLLRIMPTRSVEKFLSRNFSRILDMSTGSFYWKDGVLNSW